VNDDRDLQLFAAATDPGISDDISTSPKAQALLTGLLASDPEAGIDVGTDVDMRAAAGGTRRYDEPRTLHHPAGLDRTAPAVVAFEPVAPTRTRARGRHVGVLVAAAACVAALIGVVTLGGNGTHTERVVTRPTTPVASSTTATTSTTSSTRPTPPTTAAAIAPPAGTSRKAPAPTPPSPCEQSTVAACGPVVWSGPAPTNAPITVAARVVEDRVVSGLGVIHFEYRGADPDGGLRPGLVRFGDGRWSNPRYDACTGASPTGTWTPDQARALRRAHTVNADGWTPIDLQLNAGGAQLPFVGIGPGTYTAHLEFDSKSCAGFDDAFASTATADVTFTINADGTLGATGPAAAGG